MAKFSKDGQAFYEIPDDEDSLRKATEKGYEPYIDVSKGADSDIFTIKANPVEYKKAQAKGYTAISAQNAKTELDRADYDNPLAAGAMGAANTMSMGLNDEIGGAAHALANPSRFSEAYTEGRDKIRRTKEGLAEANPKASLGGSIAGAFVAPGAAGVGSGLLKSAGIGAGMSVGQGAATRFGDAKGGIGDQLQDTFDPQGIAIDAGIGAVAGSAGSALSNMKGARKAVSEAASEGGNVIKKGADIAGQLSHAAKEGAKDTGALAVFTGPIAAIKKASAMVGEGLETRQLAGEFRKHIGPGHSKDMTDHEVIMRMVDEGNDQAVKFVAGRASQASGVEADVLEQLLKAGPAKRSAARKFDFDTAGGELSDSIGKLSDTLESGVKSRRGELEAVARGSYNGDTQGILSNIEKQIFSAGELNSTKGAQKVLQDVQSIIASGKNADDLGLKAGNWIEHDGAEQFNRLQKARQHLDNSIDWNAIKSGSRSPTSIERKLMQVRDQVDESLKGASEAKVDSDSMVQQLMGLKKSVLAGAKHKGEFDKYKVGGMLKDTQTAKRFRDNLDLLNEFADRPGLPDSIKESVIGFRDQFAKHLDTADLKRALQRFEDKTVGSSKSGRAAQSAESLKRGDNQLQELIKAPEQGLRTREQLISQAEKGFGKPYSEFSEQEKKQLIRFMTMVKKNPDLNFAETFHVWNESKPK